MGERKYLRLDLVRETTKVVNKIRQKMKVAQSRQKCYAAKKRPLKFKIDDKVFLKSHEVWEEMQAKSSIYRTI